MASCCDLEETMNDAVRAKGKAGQTVSRTASKEVRRMQLIEATIDSIAKYGISGTTMHTVTEAAGLSIGIVNFHFQSKKNLLEETLVHLAKEHRDQWKRGYGNADLNAPAKILAIVDAHFHPKICGRKKLAVWFAFYGEAGRREVYRARVDQIDDKRFEISTQLCRKIKEEGQYEGVDPHDVALTLEALYDGMCLNILMYPKSFSRTAARTHIRRYLATVFPRHFDMPTGPS